ncbi:MAG: hypothetical protein K2I13_03285, partial [Alistipes sp.]|nr:hypothetical protein [Alistipes sp.]
VASYFDQVRTNLTLDVPLADCQDTMRVLDLTEYHSLKPFSESLLANTIGISAIWYTKHPHGDKSDRLQFFLKPRRSSVGIFAKMMGTVSCVMEPPPNNSFADKTLEEYAAQEILRRFYYETGFNLYMQDHQLTENCINIIPLAFTRELARGGKPQFFFLLETPYISDKNLSKYFRKSFNGRRDFRNGLFSRMLTYCLSPETFTNFLFAFRHLQRNRHLDYIDLDD